MAVTAVYSLRRNHASYTGSVVTLREDAGDTTLAFKLNGSNVLVSNDINEDTVAEWLAANDALIAFVTQLWDHSGNGHHAVQATTRRQPQLITSGLGSLPCLLCSGKSLVTPISIVSAPDLTVFVSFAVLANPVDQLILHGSAGTPQVRIRLDAADYVMRVGNSGDKSGGQPDTSPHVIDVRESSGVFQCRVDKTQIGTNGTNTTTGNVGAFHIGSFSTPNTWAHALIAEVALYNEALDDTARNTAADDFTTNLGAVTYAPVLEKVVVDVLTLPDAIDAIDVDGDGRTDPMVHIEGGPGFWYQQASAGVFTKRTIRSTGLTGTIEGCCWFDPNGDGHQYAAAAHQTSGEIAAYKQDSLGTPTGTWTRGVIATTLGTLQSIRAFDVDGDGGQELIFTSETNGIGLLKYDGVGDVVDSASWDLSWIATQASSWWIYKNRLDLGGSGAIDLLCSARNGAMLFWLSPNSPVTDPWTQHDIYNPTTDILHPVFGNFFGNGIQDIGLHEEGGVIYLFDGSGGWASPVTPTVITSDVQHAGWNMHVLPAALDKNGRSRFVTMGDGMMQVCAWTGSAWAGEYKFGDQQKQDDAIREINADGDFFTADSVASFVSFWRLNFPVPGTPRIVGSHRQAVARASTF